jgi:hypothetical protein
MRIVFVGITRNYHELPESYRDDFNQYHLELPYYYAAYGPNDIDIATVDYEDSQLHIKEGSLCCTFDDRVKHWINIGQYQLVVHWRKWFPEFYSERALHVINCQDHSFSPEWKRSVIEAFKAGHLYGILCFPTWHKENLYRELEGNIPMNRLIDGVTLGVDTDIYKPDWSRKDPFQMLWASDPGRGLSHALSLAIELYRRDKRFKLVVCHPDYVRGITPIQHPAIDWRGNVPNGPELWDLFNTSGVLPYTSTFMEPSSRAHRQGQAAGCLVLYPPDKGSPSHLIKDGTGIVAPISQWTDIIYREVTSGGWMTYGYAAREFALLENWQIQAKRFTLLFEEIVKCR